MAKLVDFSSLGQPGPWYRTKTIISLMSDTCLSYDDTSVKREYTAVALLNRNLKTSDLLFSSGRGFWRNRSVNPGDPKQQPFQWVDHNGSMSLVQGYESVGSLPCVLFSLRPTEAGDAAGHSVIYSSVAEATWEERSRDWKASIGGLCMLLV